MSGKQDGTWLTPWDDGDPDAEIRLQIDPRALDAAQTAESERLLWLDGIKRRLRLVTAETPIPD
jgi:hypothetical protein